MDDVRMEDKPFNRLTELCDQMSKVLEAPENADVKAIIMLHDGEHGGIETLRIEDQNETIAVMVIHLKAIFAAHGKTFTIITDDHIYTP